MTKAVIIEDETLAAAKLKAMIKKVAPELDVVAVLSDITGAIEWLSENKADLIFCDIHLGDGLSFEIFEQVKTDAPIIFTTAYDQHAIKAFKVNSIDYLLKPFSTTDLLGAIDKFRQRFSEKPVDINALLASYLSGSKTYKKRFAIYIGDKIITINTDDIAYFYAEGKYVFLVLPDGKEHIVDYTLERLSQVLDPEQFFRINRQFIVSMRGIGKMHLYTRGRVKIDLQPPAKKEVVVSSEKAQTFKKWINS